MIERVSMVFVADVCCLLQHSQKHISSGAHTVEAHFQWSSQKYTCNGTHRSTFPAGLITAYWQLNLKKHALSRLKQDLTFPWGLIEPLLSWNSQKQLQVWILLQMWNSQKHCTVFIHMWYTCRSIVISVAYLCRQALSIGPGDQRYRIVRF